MDLETRTKCPTLIRNVIAREEVLESMGEELRVLYVALTRAKEKLIVTGTLKDPETKVREAMNQALYHKENIDVYKRQVGLVMMAVIFLIEKRRTKRGTY